MIDSIPQLARGCRIQTRSEEETVLLLPEGLLRLKGAAAEILALVDGQRSVARIIDLLQQNYPAEAHAQIAKEAESFLSSLHTRSLLVFHQP